MDFSTWVNYISKNSNTLKIDHSLLNFLSSFPVMDLISGHVFSLTNPIYMITCLFVNKPQTLFCDRTLLNVQSLLHITPPYIRIRHFVTRCRSSVCTGKIISIQTAIDKNDLINKREIYKKWNGTFR